MRWPRRPHLQILTRLSHPPVAIRFTAAGATAAVLPSVGLMAGAHETALQPMLCALNGADDSHWPSAVWLTVDTLPSADAHARIAPAS